MTGASATDRLSALALGRTLFSLRERAGLTQHDLARAIGESQSGVCRAEAGDASVGSGRVALAAAALGRSPEDVASIAAEALRRAIDTASAALGEVDEGKCVARVMGLSRRGVEGLVTYAVEVSIRARCERV